MSLSLIQTLIDKDDLSETVRDRIGEILAMEFASQTQLAIDDGKPDPTQWSANVYIENSNPIENWLNLDAQTATAEDLLPVINVWFERANTDKSASAPTRHQKVNGTFNVDVYAYAISEDDGGMGHKPGDREAALKVQRYMKLVRNILMAGQNNNLQLYGQVADRMIESIEPFQPGTRENPLQQIQAGRLVLSVRYTEEAPQYIGEPLDIIHQDLHRAEDGKLIAEVELDFTQP